MLFFFLIDTSPCMLTPTFSGLTYLDIAKSSVEHFVEQRKRELVRDQFLLATTHDFCVIVDSDEEYDDGISPLTFTEVKYAAANADAQYHNTHILCSWHHTTQRFIQKLKNISPHNLPPSSTSSSTPVAPPQDYLSYGISGCLDVLNRYSRPKGIDNFTAGRIPWFSESAALIVYTTDIDDKEQMAEPHSLLLPSHVPGSAFSDSVFRWDQRIHSVLLQIPPRASDYPFKSSSQRSMTLALTSALTGGALFKATSLRSLQTHIESLSAKFQSGVVVSFHTPNPQTSQTLAFMHVKQTSGHWPIPESYTPTATMLTIPVRTAHPHLLPASTPHFIPAQIANNQFPNDRYEIESNHMLTTLMQNDAVGTCRYVRLHSPNQPASSPSTLASPTSSSTAALSSSSNNDALCFALLVYSKATNRCTLIVLPLNFMKLLKFLDQLSAQHKLLHSTSFNQGFAAYFASLPPYMLPALRAYMNKRHPAIQVGDGLPERDELKYCKQWAQNLMATEVKMANSQHNLNATNKASSSPQHPSYTLSDRVKDDKRHSSSLADTSHMSLEELRHDKRSARREERRLCHLIFSRLQHYPHLLLSFPTPPVQLFSDDDDDDDETVGNEKATTEDGGRRRLKFRPRTETAAQSSLHTVPIALMGDYLSALRANPPLRDPFNEDETDNERISFGSPFRKRTINRLKSDSSDDVMIDEAELGLTVSHKRQRGATGSGVKPTMQQFVNERNKSAAQTPSQTGKTKTIFGSVSVDDIDALSDDVLQAIHDVMTESRPQIKQTTPAVSKASEARTLTTAIAPTAASTSTPATTNIERMSEATPPASVNAAVTMSDEWTQSNHSDFGRWFTQVFLAEKTPNTDELIERLHSLKLNVFSLIEVCDVMIADCAHWNGAQKADILAVIAQLRSEAVASMENDDGEWLPLTEES